VVDQEYKIEEFELNPSSNQDGVYILSEIKNDFESLYLKVRDKEKRIYSDDELILLPFASDGNIHKAEWNLRAKSFNRFKEYLNTKTENINILDLGCGNGWFCGQLSRTMNHNLFCVDINFAELRQGSRVFNSNKLKFIYADIFSVEFPVSYFNLITLNASIQYFLNFKRIIDRLLGLLNGNGEIHIIDSPFYPENEVSNAGRRTNEYFKSIGFPEMSKHYYHHSLMDLNAYDHEIHYKPNTLINKFKTMFFINDSPFPWIMIKK
jgi:SAM-dependent methyltransferase